MRCKKMSDIFEQWFNNHWSLDDLKALFGNSSPDANADNLVRAVTTLYDVTQNGSSVKADGQQFVLETLLWIAERDFPLNQSAMDMDRFANKIITATENKSSLALIDEQCPAYLTIKEKTGHDFLFDPRIRTGVNFGQAGLAAMLMSMPEYDVNARYTYSQDTLLERCVMSPRAPATFVQLLIELGANPLLKHPIHGGVLHHLNFMNDLGVYSKFDLLLRHGADPSEPLSYEPQDALALDEYFDDVPSRFDSFLGYLNFIDDGINAEESERLREVIGKYERMRSASDEVDASSLSVKRKPAL